MTETYRIADGLIEIHSLYADVHELCRDYRAVGEGEPDLTVCVTPADIAREREKSAREAALEGRRAAQYSDGYLETLAVYRKIAEWMPTRDTFLFHGSAIVVDGQGYLFTARSGTGKSTHARLWRQLLQSRAIMVNDDKPLIRMADTGAIVFGTPWNGKHRLGENIAVPLKAICVLNRSPENHIRPIVGAEALPTLLQQAYRPHDAAAMARTLQLIDRLAGCVRLYRLDCNMDIEAAKVAYNAMKG